MMTDVVMTDVGTQEKRTIERASVRWPVHARARQGLMPRALARDVSTRGVFVQVRDQRALPDRGQHLALRLFPSGAGGYLDLRGTVRWAGFSRRHHCWGVGIEYEIVAAAGANPWAA
ncbi:PilZ domain-containing protein [Myxococcota bacterium]